MFSVSACAIYAVALQVGVFGAFEGRGLRSARDWAKTAGCWAVALAITAALVILRLHALLSGGSASSGAELALFILAVICVPFLAGMTGKCVDAFLHATHKVEEHLLPWLQARNERAQTRRGEAARRQRASEERRRAIDADEYLRSERIRLDRRIADADERYETAKKSLIDQVSELPDIVQKRRRTARRLAEISVDFPRYAPSLALATIDGTQRVPVDIFDSGAGRHDLNGGAP